MKATIINIGDELLIGQVLNTNASDMSQMLTRAGIEVVRTVVCADQADAIDQALRQALQSADAVLITGGLGPTKDDITKHTLCQYFGSSLHEDADALANVKRIFDARGYELTPINRQQAWVPDNCTVIVNTVGTAPAMWFDIHDNNRHQVVVSMPGVPFEMRHLMQNEIVPRLQTTFHTDIIIQKNILVQGIGESFLSDLIEPWETSLASNLSLAYLPVAGMVKLRLTAHGDSQSDLQQQIAEAIKGLNDIANKYIVGYDFETLPEAVADIFVRKGLTLAVAESCTGGNIASQLTLLPGASQYLKGGVVAYSNEVKRDILGVQQNTLDTYGAVSEQTVREMAEGVRQRLNADYGIATSGIAGPTGGTPQKPVGTVWFGIATPTATYAKMMKYGDRRAQTIQRASNEMFSLLIHETTK